MKQLLVLVTVFTFTLLAAFASAQDTPHAWTANDPDLEWGPCPAFMLESCAIAVLQGAPEDRVLTVK